MKLLLLLALADLTLTAATYDVRKLGAKADGISKDTVAFQTAIDAAAKQGGGTVLVPTGAYISGTLFLKSNITIHIEAGAKILFSPDNADFAAYEPLTFKPVDDAETSYFRYALFTGENVENITIEGSGTIDGNRQKRGGPKPIALKNSQHITIRGITIRNAPNYNISLLGCDYVNIDGVTILNGFSDGIDPDSCRFVRIANCYIDSHDDAICPKASRALGAPRSTENLTVTNCITRTACNHFKFGTESAGGLRNVTVSNLVMLPRESDRAPISGISLESVDGGVVEGITISNISMRGVRVPIFLRLGNRGRGMESPVAGKLENVTITNVTAMDAEVASSITGLPGVPVRNVILDNIVVRSKGGGNLVTAEIPEHPAKYPEALMFGELPAHSLFIRHAEGITLGRWKGTVATPDKRPAFVFLDIAGPQP